MILPAVLLAFAIGLGALGPAFAQSLSFSNQDPVAGSRVFGSKGCSKCHAVGGLGGAVGPDLARVPRPRSFYDLAAAMWNHLPGMAERMRELDIPRPRLDARETGDLIAFLYTLDYFDPPGSADAGRRLFLAKRCVACHQVEGTGGVVGPNLDFFGQRGSPILVATAMWNHGPAMARAMRGRGIERPSFKDTELRDLVTYLRSAATTLVEGPLHVLPGRPQDGRRLFVEKRCVHCHGLPGHGSRVGPDLAERAADRSLLEFAAAMWNKAPAMTASMRRLGLSVPALQVEEMADIVAYLYSVRYFARAGDPAGGRRLVAAKGCLTCHALEGEHGKLAADLARLPGLDSAAAVIGTLWSHGAIVDERAGGQRVPWPELSAGEMADLAAFLQSGGPR